MTLVVKMHWSHYSFHPPEDSKHPQEAAEGSFSRAEPPAQTARAFIVNRLSLCGISSRERNLSPPLEPGWFQRDSERSKPNLLSLGESIPEECASSSSPVLIVNHVTEKKNLDDVWAARSLAAHSGFLLSQHVVEGLRVGFFATLSSPQLGEQGLVTQTFL